MPTKVNNLKFKLIVFTIDNLKINHRAIIVCLIQDFEADFLWKVSLKILNSGLILKTFTHVCLIQHFETDILLKSRNNPVNFCVSLYFMKVLIFKGYVTVMSLQLTALLNSFENLFLKQYKIIPYQI